MFDTRGTLPGHSGNIRGTLSENCEEHLVETQGTFQGHSEDIWT